MKVISREDVRMDKELADLFLSFKFEEQRPLSLPTVDDYRFEMREKRWKLGEGQVIIGNITLADSAKQAYLIAGQHRCTAVSIENCVVPMTVCFMEFDTYREMVDYYAEVTNKGKPMSLGASLKVKGTSGAIGVPPYFVSAAASAVGLIINGFKHNNLKNSAGRHVKNASGMDAVLRNLEGPIYTMHCLMAGSNSKVRDMFKRQSVLSIAMLTLRYEPRRAAEFWKEVIDNDGLKKGTGQHHLRAFLTENSTSSMDSSDYAKRVAACWNVFYKYEERQILTMKIGQGPGGILIAGTPFKGQGGEPTLKILTEGATIK